MQPRDFYIGLKPITNIFTLKMILLLWTDREIKTVISDLRNKKKFKSAT